MRSILVVEDEPQIAALVRDYLIRGGFEPIVAHDGETGQTAPAHVSTFYVKG